jgi:hypothetical protein
MFMEKNAIFFPTSADYTRVSIISVAQRVLEYYIQNNAMPDSIDDLEPSQAGKFNSNYDYNGNILKFHVIQDAKFQVSGQDRGLNNITLQFSIVHENGKSWLIHED